MFRLLGTSFSPIDDTYAYEHFQTEPNNPYVFIQQRTLYLYKDKAAQYMQIKAQMTKDVAGCQDTDEVRGREYGQSQVSAYSLPR